MLAMDKDGKIFDERRKTDRRVVNSDVNKRGKKVQDNRKEDRRKEICKDVKKAAEDAKVAIRNIRRDMTDELKKIEKTDNLPEDAVKDNQDKIQKITDKYVKIIDDHASEKEKEVMTV